MHDSERLSLLIGDIYDAALNPSAWPAVLEKTAQFVGGTGASIFSKDASSKTGNLAYHGEGIDQRFVGERRSFRCFEINHTAEQHRATNVRGDEPQQQ